MTLAALRRSSSSFRRRPTGVQTPYRGRLFQTTILSSLLFSVHGRRPPGFAFLCSFFVFPRWRGRASAGGVAPFSPLSCLKRPTHDTLRGSRVFSLLPEPGLPPMTMAVMRHVDCAFLLTVPAPALTRGRSGSCPYSPTFLPGGNGCSNERRPAPVQARSGAGCGRDAGGFADAGGGHCGFLDHCWWIPPAPLAPRALPAPHRRGPALGAGGQAATTTTNQRSPRRRRRRRRF